MSGTELDTFYVVKQDDILAEMQAYSLSVFRDSTATPADKSSAIVAFAQASTTRHGLEHHAEVARVQIDARNRQRAAANPAKPAGGPG
jgi:hypothetical protein